MGCKIGGVGAGWKVSGIGKVDCGGGGCGVGGSSRLGGIDFS